MAALLSTVSGLAPAPNPHLVAFTASSLGACIAFYYAVEGVVRVRGKSMSERPKSWVLSTLSRCVRDAIPPQTPPAHASAPAHPVQS